ncbi:MAG: PhnD/SsuA/transferrin family substrate-binding protein [Rhodocyclaceae bacterium]|nr:PhnD/SsuA/transferrin family substrate-binding protein [Rhodocyclaceae bacterium]
MRSWLRRLAACLCLLGAASPPFASEPVRIGVLVNRPSAQAEAKWRPLAATLKRTIPEREFAIEALDAPALEAAVAARQLDFVLTQPAHYVLMARRSGLSAPLTTLVGDHRGKPLQVAGGVVIARADSAGLDEMQDLRGKTVATVGTQSLVGFLAQARELAALGIGHPRDFRLLATGYPQDKVVEAVLEGRADAGFLLAGVVEEMAARGRLDLARLKVINRQNLPDFPHAVSTRLYPGWPFAALPHAPADLSRKVAAALLSLEEYPAAVAMGIHGFTVPANYGAVEELMRELRAPPFDAMPEFTWRDVWARYRAGWAALAIAGALILLLSLRLYLGKRRMGAQARALAEERRRLGDILYGTRAGTWEWNMQSGETVFNARWAEIVGHTLEELAPLSIETWSRLTHPEDLQRSNVLLARHFAGELDNYVCEARMRHKDGHWVWVMDRGRLVSRTPDGRPLLMSGTHQDITARKQADEALRRSEERLRLVMEATADGIWDYDPVTRCTFFSDNFVALLGYASRDAMRPAFRLGDALHAEDRERVLQAQQRSLADGAAFDETYRLRLADGSWRWFHGRGMTLQDGAGRPARFIGVLTDIDAMKRAEQEIVDLNRQLDARVRLRTAELETALHELEDFSYAASHDLRAPLRAVDGFAQILGEEYAPRLDDAAQGYLQRIRLASRHLSAVIDNMIELIRVTRAELHPAEVDLAGLVRRILGELQAREPRAVDIVVGDGLTARADPDLIAAALWRLLHNAWKFTGQTPHARIEVGAVDQGGERVFYVADNGAGFDPAYAGRLFRPFFRLHRPDEFSGAGIGLAIVQRIVRRHGSRIWAAAAKDQGATFYFTLSTPDLHRPEMT